MSAGRAAPWRSKPSQELQALVATLSQPSSAGNSSSSSWYVLQRLGPSSFVVGQDPGGDKFKVALGNQPTCSCRLISTSPQEPCVHLLFIMLRVMRLSAANPLLWQSALTDRELQELLDGRLSSSRGNAGRAAGRRSSSSSSSSGKPDSSVQRRTIEQDEPCPICYESLSNVDAAWLVWCKNSCGKSIHGRCMRVWSDHQTKTLQQELSCPLCRCPWGRLDWSPPAAPAASAEASSKVAALPRNVHKGVSCSGCQQASIAGCRYRCLECANYNLCHACFSAGQHLQHSFVCCATPSAPEQLAERPVQLGLQCNGFAQGAASDSVHHSRSSNGSRAPGSEGASHRHSQRIRGRLPAGCSKDSRSSKERSSGLPEAAGRSVHLGLQCSSLVHCAERGVAQASGSSSSTITSSMGEAGQHDGSSNMSRQDHSSSGEHRCRARSGSNASAAASAAAAAGAAAAARLAAAAAGAATEQAQPDQDGAVIGSASVLSIGLQLSSINSRSSSSAGSTQSSSEGRQLMRVDCPKSSNDISLRIHSSTNSSKTATRGSSSQMQGRAPAESSGRLHSGCKPPDAVQYDFAALVLSGHAAPGSSAPAAPAVSAVTDSAWEGMLPTNGTAGAEATAASKCSSCPGHAVPVKKGHAPEGICKREIPNARTAKHAAAQLQRQQQLAVCGMGAAALHLAQTRLI